MARLKSAEHWLDPLGLDRNNLLKQLGGPGGDLPIVDKRTAVVHFL
jgi:hypothetical protein